jgi:hypothetical protein
MWSVVSTQDLDLNITQSLLSDMLSYNCYQDFHQLESYEITFRLIVIFICKDYNNTIYSSVPLYKHFFS